MWANMPSPLLHASAGASLCLLAGRNNTAASRWLMPVVFAAAILPDFDVLAGLLLQQPNRFHQGASHSLGAAVFAAGLAAMFARSHRWLVLKWVFLAWTGHCLLDLFVTDGRPPIGIPLFWPFSDRAIQIAPILPGLRHGDDETSNYAFLMEVLSTSNLRVIAIELVLGAAIVTAGAWVCRGRAQAVGNATTRSHGKTSL